MDGFAGSDSFTLEADPAAFFAEGVDGYGSDEDLPEPKSESKAALRPAPLPRSPPRQKLGTASLLPPTGAASPRLLPPGGSPGLGAVEPGGSKATGPKADVPSENRESPSAVAGIPAFRSEAALIDFGPDAVPSAPAPATLAAANASPAFDALLRSLSLQPAPDQGVNGWAGFTAATSPTPSTLLRPQPAPPSPLGTAGAFGGGPPLPLLPTRTLSRASSRDRTAADATPSTSLSAMGITAPAKGGQDPFAALAVVDAGASSGQLQPMRSSFNGRSPPQALSLPPAPALGPPHLAASPSPKPPRPQFLQPDQWSGFDHTPTLPDLFEFDLPGPAARPAASQGLAPRVSNTWGSQEWGSFAAAGPLVQAPVNRAVSEDQWTDFTMGGVASGSWDSTPLVKGSPPGPQSGGPVARTTSLLDM